MFEVLLDSSLKSKEKLIPIINRIFQLNYNLREVDIGQDEIHIAANTSCAYVFSANYFQRNKRQIKKFLKQNESEIWAILISDCRNQELANTGIKNIFTHHKDEVEEIENLLRLLEMAALKIEVQVIIQIAYQGYEKILSDSKTYFDRVKDRIRDDFSLLDSMISIHLHVLQISSQMKAKLLHLQKSTSGIKTLEQICEEALELNGIIKSVSFCDCDDYVKLKQEKERNHTIIPLPNSGYLSYSLNQSVFTDNLQSSLFVFLLVEELERFRTLFQERKNIELSDELWEEPFARIPRPIVVISEFGELILHNSEFLKLGILPKDCIALSDDDKLENELGVFKVFRNDLKHEGKNYHYFVFTAESPQLLKSFKNMSSGELGIISSSLAHELNNPLSGIIAAIALLKLSHDWDEESCLQLIEMEKGAKRCKHLIDIFLGFSKAALDQNPKGVAYLAFEQAIGLLRFRMMESDVRLDIGKVEPQNSFQQSVNTSVIAMIFYLVLSEVMTAFSQYRLIWPKCGNTVIGSFCEEQDRLTIRFKKSLDYVSKVEGSKLIQYLLELEDLELKATSSQVVINLAPAKKIQNQHFLLKG